VIHCRSCHFTQMMAVRWKHLMAVKNAERTIIAL
jgi:hypothetical protein